jgi:putative transcriptional regulator
VTDGFDAHLAPGFLIAPPPLADPNFHQTLVLLAVHDEGGSMGFVVNRRSSLKLRALLSELSIAASVDDREVLYGGPVSGFSGFVLYEHPEGDPLAPGIAITDRIGVSPSRDLLEMAAADKLPGRFELLLGYAGWAPEQLDGELGRGGWLHSPFDAELLFDVGVDERYDEAYSRLGVDSYNFVNVPGGAQA